MSRPKEVAVPWSNLPLVFDPGRHRYTHGKTEFKSVTKLIGKFKRHFDSDYWSKRKAAEEGITQAEILARWDAKRDASTDLGHAVHEYAEFRAMGQTDRFFITGRSVAPGRISGFLSGVDRAYCDIPICPVDQEKIVGAPFGLAGTIDLLANVPGAGDGVVIFDWKTNEEIKTANRWGKMSGPCSHLDCCEFNHYSLQLSIYRLILERYYGMNVNAMALIHLDGRGGFNYLPVPYLKREVALMLWRL